MLTIMFWKGKTGLYGRLIRLVSAYPYTHVELQFSNGCRFGINYDMPAQFYVPTTRGPLVWDPLDWDGYEIPPAYVDEARVRRWCMTVQGAQYDWRGIVCSQVLPFGIEHPERWFCSELVTAALQAGGNPWVANVKPQHISPSRLADILISHGARLVLS